MSIVTLEFSI